MDWEHKEWVDDLKAHLKWEAREMSKSGSVVPYILYCFDRAEIEEAYDELQAEDGPYGRII